LFGTDTATPFEKKGQTEWSTTTAGTFKEIDQKQMIPTAGGGANARSGNATNDSKM
jgi:hypothetical protein